MDGPGDYHTQWSKSEKDKRHMLSLYVESRNTNEPVYKTKQNRKTQDLENRVVVAKGEGGEGGKDWEIGISKYKL